MQILNAVPFDVADSELFDVINEHTRSKSKPTPYTKKDVELALAYAYDIVEKSEQNGIGIITYFDADYPSTLVEYKNNTNKQISPPILYYKGNISLLANDLVTVIGSRDCDNTLFRTSSYIASEFAKRGFPIVSGLALGCDTYAHKGALKADRQTIGILAGGLSDSAIYPKENIDLAQEIIEKDGLLISEYAFNKNATRYTFVQRDLIQAAVSKATILIASTINGGSMHASKECSRLKKSLYAMEYREEKNIPKLQIEGNACLIKEHNAKSINAFSSSKEDVNMLLDKIASDIRDVHTEPKQRCLI